MGCAEHMEYLAGAKGEDAGLSGLLGGDEGGQDADIDLRRQVFPLGERMFASENTHRRAHVFRWKHSGDFLKFKFEKRLLAVDLPRLLTFGNITYRTFS